MHNVVYHREQSILPAAYSFHILEGATLSKLDDAQQGNSETTSILRFIETKILPIAIDLHSTHSGDKVIHDNSVLTSLRGDMALRTA